MSLVVFEGVSLHFGAKRIVSDLGLRIGEGERIGLIGANGSGKTTLLRLIAGEQTPDAGRLRTRKGVRVGYLPQDLAVKGGRSLADFVLGSVPGRADVAAELADAEASFAAIEGDPQRDDDALMDAATRLSEAHERLDHFDEHYSAHQAYRILSGLGFRDEDRERDVAEFSGGWKMRAVLAALLFQRPDLLLLDEPTNHLDMPSVTWLGDFLKRTSSAYVLISHDREFVDDLVTRIVSFESEGVRQYEGNVRAYLRQRAEEEEVLGNKARNLQRERDKAEEFIDKFRAKASKARAVQSRVKALEKLETVETFTPRKAMKLRFPPAARSSGEPLRVDGLHKRYGELHVLRGVTLRVARGDRIGIVGVNGAGKTTLLRMMAGELTADAGEVRVSGATKLSYFAQHHSEALHADRSIYDEVAAANPAANQTHVRTLLGAFMFSGDDVDKRVGVLSGGERARVALARMLVDPGNVLVMDEPTNHLDLQSSEELAEALAEFDGTLIFVSHNRAFLDRLATRLWVVADGRVEDYPGNLADYMDSWRRRFGGDEAPAAGGGAGKAATGGGRGPSPGGTRAGAGSSGAADGGEARGSKASAAGSVAAAPRPRGDDKARRREEAAQRAERNKRLAPLRQRLAALEADIERLEAEQKRRSLELAEGSGADGATQAERVRAFADGQRRLGELNDAWIAAGAELELAESE